MYKKKKKKKKKNMYCILNCVYDTTISWIIVHSMDIY